MLLAFIYVNLDDGNALKNIFIIFHIDLIVVLNL